MTLLYNFSLFVLMFVFFPKLLWQSLFKGKYRKSFFSRVSGKSPGPAADALVIWLHAVSVGESKALSTLAPHIRKSYPNAFILVSTVTETGRAEAERLITCADAFCYLPLDFSWVVRRFVTRLRPDLLVLVEGDFWYNLLSEVKKVGGSVVLVNGKISETSFKRHLLFKSFSQSLFKKIDTFCVQSEEYLERFLKLGVPPEKITVIENLKYDIPMPENLGEENWQEKLGIRQEDTVITIGSTHEREEALLLQALRPLWDQFDNLKLLLVPRHPERFQRVEKLLQGESLSYATYSSPNKKGDEKILLVDEMGILPQCYRASHLSIVGGSFVQGIGGHDIFEPAKMGTPVFFGPYMHNQKELTQTLTQSGVGKQVTIEELTPILERYLSTPSLISEGGEKGKRLAQKVMGSAFRTWNHIHHFVHKTS